MKKINPLKLTLVIIPLAIMLTFLVRYIVNIVLGSAMHPAFALVTYIAIFAVLKIMGEKMVHRGKFPWLLSEEN